MLPAALLPRAAASGPQPSLPSLSEKPPQPGSAHPPAQPPAAAPSGPEGHPDCRSSAVSALDHLEKKNKKTKMKKRNDSFTYISLLWISQCNPV